jgi:hypothetical protein
MKNQVTKPAMMLKTSIAMSIWSQKRDQFTPLRGTALPVAGFALELCVVVPMALSWLRTVFATVHVPSSARAPVLTYVNAW